MEQPTLTPTKRFVRDLVNGQEVDSIFLVRSHSQRQKRNGEPFLKLQLGDVTGTVEAVVWEEVDQLAPACVSGSIVRVLGHFSVDERYGAGITVRRLRAAIDGYYHQAYRHGLLEHCLSVAQGVSALAATFPALDRDIAVSGALLHDIGKVEAYASRNGAIELTDAGKLLGEIPLGYYAVRREIEEIEGFPAADCEALLHIVLSHHGKLEHGSPVVPCTREATLVHFIDNLGGNLGSFDRIERTLADGASWSDFDRGLATSAYFGRRDRADGREAA